MSYDLSNTNGLDTDQQALVTSRQLDTNALEFTNDNFECFNVPLAVGTNIITLHGTDLAGNTSATNVVYILDPTANTNPPVMSVSWPQDGALISGTSFPVRGVVNDPFAGVAVQISNQGCTNEIVGLVERDGAFWVENVQLGDGPNYLTITATNTSGYWSASNMVVFQSPVALSITSMNFDDPISPTATVGGSLPGSSDTVWVNGVEATNNGDGTWTAYYVPVGESGTAAITAEAMPSDMASSGAGVSCGATAPDAETAEDIIRETAVWIVNLVANWSDEISTGNSGWYGWGDYMTWAYGSGGSDKNWEDSGGNPCPGYDGTQAFWGGNGVGTRHAVEITNCSGSLYVGADNPSFFSLPDDGWNGNGQWTGDGEFNQWQAQTVYRLRVGGQSPAGQQNLWAIGTTAFVWCGVNEEGGDMYCPLPETQTTVAGQVLGPYGTGGAAYFILPNGASLDLPVTAPTNDYIFVPGASAIAPPVIQANGTTLDPVKTNATFCVGQQIKFSLVGLPPCSSMHCNWTFPDKFVNSIIPNPPGSTIYTNNTSLLVTPNASCTNWYVNGSGGTVSVVANLIMPNGQSISMSATAQFAIERPQIYMTPVDIQPRFFTITSNFFGGATVKLGMPGTGQSTYGQMDYDVRCDTDFSGLGMITQTCQLAYNPDPGGFNFPDWRLDGATNYDGPTNIFATSTYVFYPEFDDGPQNGTTFSTSSIEVKGSFTDYIMFQPTNTAGSIYVTLGIVTWNMDGLITNAAAGWTFVTTNSPDPVGPNNADQFPFYTQPR
ncbi:MAG: hypothetical protein ACLQU4_17650 [Limisphaerales bacterium]